MTTNKGSDLCTKVGRPSGSTASVISKLFRGDSLPSTSKDGKGEEKSAGRKRSIQFDPKAECIVAKQQAQALIT